MSEPSLGRAVLGYTAFRLGVFVAVLVPLTVVLVVLDGPPVTYLAAVAVATLVSSGVALVKGRERRDRMERALLASRQRRQQAQVDYAARVARGHRAASSGEKPVDDGS